MPYPSNPVLALPTYAQNPLNNLTSPGQVVSQAQWTWQGTSTNTPSVQYYFNNSPTKSGITANDLRNFVGVPFLIGGGTPANPTPSLMSDSQVWQMLRQAEDWVEQESGILLTQAWIASPPVTSGGAQAISLVTTSPAASGQVLGVDYDMLDPGYDFFYRRFLMEGWGAQQLRYRPLKTVVTFAFIYPLLSEFFQVPRSWLVEDWDAAMIRIVPAANVQMLPLFAMQLAFMGFAQSLPQALYIQYIAGLNYLDYQTRYAFMKTLILSTAAVYILNTIQGSINYGVVRQATSVDGLRYETSYPANGAAYSGLLTSFTTQRDRLLRTAIDMVRGVIAFVSL